MTHQGYFVAMRRSAIRLINYFQPGIRKLSRVGVVPARGLGVDPAAGGADLLHAALEVRVGLQAGLELLAVQPDTQADTYILYF